MSYADTRRFMELEATVATLLARVAVLEAGERATCAALALVQAAQAERLAALEAAECAITSRRASDAARQQRRRSRDRCSDPVERDCSAEMP